MKRKGLILLGAIALVCIVTVLAAQPQAWAGTPVPRIAVYDQAVTGGNNVLATDLSMARQSTVRIQVGITDGQADSVVGVQLDDGSGTNLDFDLNSGTALTNGDLFTFQILVPRGWTMNVRVITTTRVTVVVQELHEGL